MSKLIGTNPNQVPSNADLGTAAFQDVSDFLTAKGSSLSALNSTILKNCRRAFIYDTSEDSDGGAWRKRCQHLSWYNEKLNTPTRGSRREFPQVAIIVVTSTGNGLYIYDADDPDIPLWMAFNYGAHGALTTQTMLYANGYDAAAKNGTICTVGIDGWNDGLVEIKFLEDTATWRNSSWVGEWHLDIARRNVQGGYKDFIANRNSERLNNTPKSVDMIVLPTAKINPATGLHIPTIGLGIGSGVSASAGFNIIRDDGEINHIVLGKGVNNVVFDKQSYNLYGSQDTFNIVQHVSRYPDYITGTRGISSNVYTGASRMYVGANAGKYDYADTHIAIAGGSDVGGTVRGLQYTYLNENRDGATMACHITKDYTTGWMPGDIAVSSLSDTVAEVKRTTELVDQTATNWTLPTGWSMSSGNLAYDGTGSQYFKAALDMNTVIGKTYTVSFDVISSTPSFSVWVNNNTSSADGNIGRVDFNTINGLGFSITFVAEDTLSTLTFQNNTASTTGSFENIFCRESEADRSYNNRGVQVFGSGLKKEPVASGSDIVAYTNFGSGRYLKWPENSDLNDSGSKNWTLNFWLNPENTTADRSYVNFVPQNQASGNYGWSISQVSGDLRIYSYNAGSYGNNANDGTIFENVAPLINSWHMVTVMHHSYSGKLSFYFDGVYTGVSNGFGLTPSARGFLAMGNYFLNASGNAKLSMLRFSASLVSAKDLKQIYEDEKSLFKPNAKATLYGNNSGVNSVSFDDRSKLLYAGGPNGTSIFNRLTRVDNTTRPVNDWIDAHNGLVVEEQ